MKRPSRRPRNPTALTSGGAGWDWESLLASYTSLGFDPGQYWSLTPRELVVRSDGANLRLRREYNDRMTQAWWMARIMWASKPIDLDSLLISETPKPRRMPWQEIKAVFQLALGPGASG